MHDYDLSTPVIYYTDLKSLIFCNGLRIIINKNSVSTFYMTYIFYFFYTSTAVIIRIFLDKRIYFLSR